MESVQNVQLIRQYMHIRQMMHSSSELRTNTTVNGSMQDELNITVK